MADSSSVNVGKAKNVVEGESTDIQHCRTCLEDGGKAGQVTGRCAAAPTTGGGIHRE